MVWPIRGTSETEATFFAAVVGRRSCSIVVGAHPSLPSHVAMGWNVVSTEPRLRFVYRVLFKCAPYHRTCDRTPPSRVVPASESYGSVMTVAWSLSGFAGIDEVGCVRSRSRENYTSQHIYFAMGIKTLEEVEPQRRNGIRPLNKLSDPDSLAAKLAS